MSAVSLLLHQLRYDQKTFWRRPAAVFFTVGFPIILLLIFATIFGDETIPGRGGVKTTTYYVPAIITLAVIAATMVSPAMSITIERENGLLKRVRGTPLPPWVFVGGRVGNALVVSLLMVVLVSAIGRIVYGVSIPTTTIPAILVTLVIGAASFACMGFALTCIIPSEESAAAITNAIALPLYFISGIFIPESEIPSGVLEVADVFPIRHLFEAFFAAYDPATSGLGIEWGHLAVVAAWGLGGLLVAVRFFRWTPRES